ncbi:MAG TPA: 50S ribosomal protein L21 [bacterium]|nr:50S ribosomal protein L21 [bacterium]
MSKLAVIKTGGKQYVVKEGQVLKIEKLAESEKKDFSFSQVLLVADETGTIKIGNPFISGTEISAELLKTGRARKIRVVHYKPKTRQHKVYGHRQPFSQVKIKKIN